MEAPIESKYHHCEEFIKTINPRLGTRTTCELARIFYQEMDNIDFDETVWKEKVKELIYHDISQFPRYIDHGDDLLNLAYDSMDNDNFLEQARDAFYTDKLKNSGKKRKKSIWNDNT